MNHLLLIRHELTAIAIRAEPVEAQESTHISTSSMRMYFFINHSESIVYYTSICRRILQQALGADESPTLRKAATQLH